MVNKIDSITCNFILFIQIQPWQNFNMFRSNNC